MKNTVHFGFVAIIFIMTLLAFVWLGQIKSSNEKVLDLIEQFDQKINYAQTMHNTIRVRQNLLLSMLVIDDSFEQDDKLQKFYHVASEYRLARNALQALPMTEEEKQLHKLLDKQASIAQPVNKRAAEMFQSGASKSEIIMVINEASRYQDKLLQTLQHFVNLQKTQDEAAVNFSRKQFDDSIYWISFFGLIAFLIAVLVSRYVGKSVADNNMALQKAYKKAEETTVIKSEFLAAMSHEIRTPLTAIIGFAETTLFSEQSEEQKQNAIQTIIRSGKHLLQIINDILDLSKVEANKIEIESVKLSPFELLVDVERLVRPEAEEKGLGFSINYIFPLPEYIKSDPLRLKQILINLCNNAIKFTDQGYITINVSCNCDRTNNGIVFEVVDSGIGIKEEDQHLIFHAYRQADSSTTRKFGGTGLGLSLSKILAERMSGTLTVTSEVGKGSKFRLFLASNMVQDSKIVFDNEHLPDVNQVKEYTMPAGHLSGSILLAEDNLDNQELLLIYLHRMGLNVTVVENGKLAVEAAAKNNFDLILMDMRMPVMGGLEAIRVLRQQGIDMPIVALTANAMREDKAACFKAGCNGFLTKPIDVAHLNEIISKYLNVNTQEINDAVSLVSTLLEEDPEALDLIKRFVGNLSTALKEIKILIENSEWDNLSAKLHQIKGTGGNFGFPDVSTIAEKMELKTADHNTAELNKLLSELTSTYEKIVLGLK